MFGGKNAFRMSRALAWTLLIGFPAVVPLETARAQDLQNMPSMEVPAQATAVSGTGTVTAVNTAGRKVKLDHGPIPAVKWPAMKMEFSTAPSIDLSKAQERRQSSVHAQRLR